MPRHAALPRRSHRSVLGLSAVAGLAIVVAILVPSAASVADPTLTPPASTIALSPVDLGAAGAYSVMASTALTSAGSTFAGAIGTSASSTPLQVQQDLTTAYSAAASLTPTALIAGDLGGRVLSPGIYHADAALAMSTSLTFDALGNADAVFVIQVGAAVNTTAATRMILANGALASHVFWQVAGAVTTGANSYFIGTILGNAAITAGAGTVIDGRALTQGGAVTLSNVALLAVPDVALSTLATPSVDVEAGDSVVFSDVIHNRGNVDLAIDLSTGLPFGSVTAVDWPTGSHLLAVGQSVTATTTYLPTIADASVGSVTADATVTATPQGEAAVTATSRLVLIVHPTPVADSVSTTQATPVTFNVLTNDAGADAGGTFSRAPLDPSARLVGGAAGPIPAAPQDGGVSCVDSGVNKGQCTYQPAGNFLGTDYFDYSLRQGTRSWNVRVTVAVSAGAASPTARAARVVATTGGPAVTFDPTSNSTDPGTGSLQIIAVASVPSATGSLTCTSALCTFTPSSSFTGVAHSSYTEADVSASGTQGAAASAGISIFVDPPALDATGFVAAAATGAAVSNGTWNSSTSVTAEAGTCSAGRPSTIISWQAIPSATSWVVQRRFGDSSPSAWITVATLPTGSVSYSDSAVGEGNSYQWQVRPDLQRWHGTFSPVSAVSSEPVAQSAFGC